MNKNLATNILLVSMAMLMVGCGNIDTQAETAQSVIVSETVATEVPDSTITTETTVSEVEEPMDSTEVGVSSETVPEIQPEVVESIAEQSGITAEDKTMYATASVNIRSSASADSEKLGSLNLNDSVHITGSLESGWKQIDFNGVSAYVSSQYLSDTKIAVPKKDSTVVKSPASQPQEAASSGNKNNVSAPPTQSVPSNDNAFDGDFPVDTQTPEEAAEEVRQAYIDAGWIDEDGNHIDGGNWSQ